eukprot:7670550-Pyramimonas_sp.AAC.1
MSPPKAAVWPLLAFLHLLLVPPAFGQNGGGQNVAGSWGWGTVSVNAFQDLKSIYTLKDGSGKGWASGTQDAVLRTVNGGFTWTVGSTGLGTAYAWNGV